jgi:hypothetical protein
MYTDRKPQQPRIHVPSIVNNKCTERHLTRDIRNQNPARNQGGGDVTGIMGPIMPASPDKRASKTRNRAAHRELGDGSTRCGWLAGTTIWGW